MTIGGSLSVLPLASRGWAQEAVQGACRIVSHYPVVVQNSCIFAGGFKGVVVDGMLHNPRLPSRSYSVLVPPVRSYCTAFKQSIRNLRQRLSYPSLLQNGLAMYGSTCAILTAAHSYGWICLGVFFKVLAAIGMTFFALANAICLLGSVQRFKQGKEMAQAQDPAQPKLASRLKFSGIVGVVEAIHGLALIALTLIGSPACLLIAFGVFAGLIGVFRFGYDFFAIPLAYR